MTMMMIDTDKNPKLARQWGVNGIPDMRFLDVDGKEVARYKGRRSAESFVQQFKDISQKHAVKPKEEKVNVAWIAEFEKAREASKKDHKALFVIFSDGGDAAAKTVEALTDAKFKKTVEGIVFANVKFDKDSEIAKKLKVEAAGAILVINPDEADLDKAALARKAAPLGVEELKSLLTPFEQPGFKCDKCGKTSFSKQTCDGAEMKPVERKD